MLQVRYLALALLLATVHAALPAAPAEPSPPGARSSLAPAQELDSALSSLGLLAKEYPGFVQNVRSAGWCSPSITRSRTR